jgi:hypothetical protein
MYSITGTGISERLESPEYDRNHWRKELSITPNCHWRHFLVQRVKMQHSGEASNVGIGCGFSPSYKGNTDGFVVAKLVIHL